ncbi:MAG TPA: type I methionyl aminopeptidase [Ktedonobacteraceae bacterium]|nr:type I methionyl aminopeptidase [Ktedonobacteraceae bacterium]
MVYMKSGQEIAEMRKAGLLVWQAHQFAAEMAKPGVSTAEMNEAVELFIEKNHALPLFKGVPSATGNVPFPAAACISVNNEIVHGIPGKRVLRDGDIVSIDIGCKLDGWCGDAAVTVPVGTIKPEVQRLLDVTEEALKLAIELIPQRTKWSEIAREMEQFVKNAGFSVVEGLVGHGIGRALWESPQVPNYYTPQIADFPLKPGYVIAIEPMVNMGTNAIMLRPDYWTIVTRDGKPSAHFEHTIAITDKGPFVLTAGPDGKAWAIE